MLIRNTDNYYSFGTCLQMNPPHQQRVTKRIRTRMMVAGVRGDKQRLMRIKKVLVYCYGYGYFTCP